MSTIKAVSFSFVRLGLFAVCLSVLSGCGTLGLSDRTFAPDPELQENTPVLGSQETGSQSANQAELPPDFPNNIPVYPNAQLLNVNASEEDTRTLWASPDSGEEIENFYRQELASNNWQIVEGDEESSAAEVRTRFVARQGNEEVTFSIPNVEDNSGATTFAIAYTPQSQARQVNLTTSNFSDLNAAPEQLRPYIEDLGELGVIEPATGNSFQPNETITRREYARWLVSANNRIHANQPGKQIRLAGSTNQPAFSDISADDPDFAVIQGLAEAGLIPSRLTGDSDVLFRPDAPLNREDLFLWKVPLDTRQSLPSASVEAVEQTWGFQDTTQINARALRALMADHQSGEQANVRRVFGYTTLFQPKKTVTRAEAAATLWYFGTPGEGLSAREAQQIPLN